VVGGASPLKLIGFELVASSRKDAEGDLAAAVVA
jgi:hypothetical protein